MTAKVFVTLKKGVLDPQGKAVEQSLARLGFSEAREVRVGRFIEMAVEAGSREEATKRPQAMPNNRVQATGNSLRSCFAPAISSA